LHKIGNRKRLFIIAISIFALLLLSYINSKKDFREFNYNILSSGDIVFTRGTSINSYFVLLFDRNTNNYSHCGIIYIEKNKKYIIHATPSPIDNQKGRVVMEPLNNYFYSNKVTLVSIFRLDKKYNKNINRSLTTSLKYVRDAILFDDEFCLTNDKIYCTELIWKSYHESGLDLLDTNINKRIIFPSDLTNCKFLKRIYTF